MSAETLNAAHALHAAGKTLEALALLDKARQISPGDPGLYGLMAELFAALGHDASSLRMLREAHAKFPGNARIVYLLANHYYLHDDAASGLAVTTPMLQGECPAAIAIAHAALCKLAGREPEAIAIYQQVLQSDPDHLFALANLGHLLMEVREYKPARELLERAAALSPINGQIVTHLAHTTFRMGDLAAGWRHYESRFTNGVAARPFPQPRWMGEKLSGGLLLWGEQGAGEEILYSGMIPEAAARAAFTRVECDPRLVPLFTRSYPGIQFTARANPIDPCLMDPALMAQAALGQLGGIFRNGFNDFPSSPASLKADADTQAVLRQRYQTIMQSRGLSGRIVGISWQSKKMRHGDPKSTRLAEWGPLMHGSPHLFVSLQYGDVTEDLQGAAAQGWNLISDPQIDQLASLDDFAAQVAAMDRVVTVSNTTAHMAGALQIETAVLLPKSRGLMWHWFDHTDRSPWYPTLCLLRQAQDGNWAEPLAAAAEFLK